ncbi:MAG TPA: ThuA domain-containing protein [Pseudolysinimonas sp.]|nr:ThuA domain-containing protein [Pseudolysinimonas sp.]
MRTALVFSGGGDYADPWHPYAESSEQLAELVRSWGVDVEVTDRVAPTIDALADRPGLFVINAGAGPDPHPGDAELAAAAISYVEDGGTLLVVHLSTGLFPGDDAWEELIGGRWIWDESGHPDHGTFTVQIGADELVSGLGDFAIADESYARLRLHDGVRVLAWHSHDPDGARHPLLWLRPRGPGMVVVDLLGHDGASFGNAGHRVLLERALNRA